MLRFGLLVAIAILSIVVVFVYVTYEMSTDGPDKPAILTNNVLSFDNACYVTIDRKSPIALTYSLRFDIRSTSNGLIFMMGGPATIDNPTNPFVSVWLDDGAIVVVTNGSIGLKRMISSKNRLNDDAWHTVSIIRTLNSVNLSVDGVMDQPMTIGSELIDVIDSPTMYLGGRPIDGENLKVLGISACIKNIIVNDFAVQSFKAVGRVKTEC